MSAFTGNGHSSAAIVGYLAVGFRPIADIQ